MKCFGCSASAGRGGGRKKWFVCAGRAAGDRRAPARGPAGRELTLLLPRGTERLQWKNWAPAHLGTGEKVISGTAVVGMFNLCRIGAEKHGLGIGSWTSGAVEALGWVPEELRGTARHVRGGETRRRASKRLLLRCCALGRVTFALTAWKRLPYALAYYKKQIYGLSNERRKEKKKQTPAYARTWRGPRQSRVQQRRGNACAGLWPVPRSSGSTPQPFLQESEPQRAQNIKVQTSHLVNTI